MLIELSSICSAYPSFKPRGVLHLGANYGQEQGRYEKCGITHTIFVEGVPEIYEGLAKRHNDNPNVICIQAVLSNVSGIETVMNVASNHGESSSLHDFKTHKQHHPNVHFTHQIPVTTIRFEDLKVDMDGINYLVTDLQGHDLQAMMGISDADFARFDAVYTEVSFEEVYEGCCKYEQTNEFLEARGFEMVELSKAGNGSWGDAFYIRKSLFSQ
jgi:FkbM family methyltransferase